MDPRRQTDLFLTAWIAVAVGWDVLVLLRHGVEATISARVLDWSQAHPALWGVLLVGLGVLIGHLLLPQRR